MNEFPNTTTTGDMVRACRDCGEDFEMAVGEQMWFAARNLSSPRRCKLCRNARRQQAAEEQAALDAAPLTTTRSRFSAYRGSR